jgi:hypothetical protein
MSSKWSTVPFRLALAVLVCWLAAHAAAAGGL